MLVGPGADELKVFARLRVTSSSEMSEKGHSECIGGSSGWTGGMGRGTVGKKHSTRTVWTSVVKVARLPSCFNRGGMWLTRLPWRHLVTVQSLSEVV